MGFLRRTHEWAADRGWAQYPEPEWRSMRRRRPSRLDQAFKLTIAAFLLGPIVAPVIVALLIGVVIVIGMLSR